MSTVGFLDSSLAMRPPVVTGQAGLRGQYGRDDLDVVGQGQGALSVSETTVFQRALLINYSDI